MKKIVVAIVALLVVLICVGYFLKKQNINNSIKNCAESYDLKDVSISIKKEKSGFGSKYYVCDINCSNFEDIPYSEMYQLNDAIDDVVDALKLDRSMIVYYHSNGNKYYIQPGTHSDILKNGKVIDGYDRNYSSSSSSQSSSSQSPSSTCNYKYSDGSICGASTNKYVNLCDRHFEELYSTYQSFGGTKVPK